MNMKNLKFIQPYNDDKLVFNKETGRYELNLRFLKSEYDTPYGDDGEAKRRIKLNTRVVYSYINLHVANFNRGVVSLLLHRTQEGRDFLFQILSEQIYADIQTGYNDLLYNPAISFTGQDKDRNEIRKNALCTAAEDVFLSSSDYFDINIGYLGQFPPSYYTLLRSL